MHTCVTTFAGPDAQPGGRTHDGGRIRAFSVTFERGSLATKPLGVRIESPSVTFEQT
jgi:hypothetical protein